MKRIEGGWKGLNSQQIKIPLNLLQSPNPLVEGINRTSPYYVTLWPFRILVASSGPGPLHYRSASFGLAILTSYNLNTTLNQLNVQQIWWLIPCHIAQNFALPGNYSRDYDIFTLYGNLVCPMMGVFG